jgi:hypothetical protein
VAWDIVYYKTANGGIPAVDFLVGCPTKVRANMLAVLDAVAEAPPPSFSGGGKWEAMHGDMTGYFEVRATGPGREQFRLFCVLENADDKELAARGLPGPAIAVIDGRRKPNATLFTDGEYADVRVAGDDYAGARPRRIATPADL